MGRTVLCAVLALVGMLQAQPSVAQPATLMPESGQALPLAAQARRAHLLGHVEIYRLALYVDGAVSIDRLASPDVAKALRIEITAPETCGRVSPSTGATSWSPASSCLR